MDATSWLRVAEPFAVVIDPSGAAIATRPFPPVMVFDDQLLAKVFVGGSPFMRVRMGMVIFELANGNAVYSLLGHDAARGCQVGLLVTEPN